jgi:hypothetical protein
MYKRQGNVVKSFWGILGTKEKFPRELKTQTPHPALGDLHRLDQVQFSCKRRAYHVTQA